VYEYLQGWFTVDFLSSVPINLMVPGNSGAANSNALLRALKLIKLIKLSRMMRLGRLVAKVQDQLQIKFSFLMIYKFLFMFIIAVHWLGCAFYFFTSMESDGDQDEVRFPSLNHDA